MNEYNFGGISWAHNDRVKDRLQWVEKSKGSDILKERVNIYSAKILSYTGRKETR